MSYYSDLADKCGELARIDELITPVIRHHMIRYVENIVVEFTDIEDITEIRATLRDALGSWNDKLKMTWPCAGTIMTEWTSVEWPVALWLKSMPETFPTSLLKDGCRLEKSVSVDTEWNVVCDV